VVNLRQKGGYLRRFAVEKREEIVIKKAETCGKLVAKRDRVRSRKKHIFDRFAVKRGIFVVDL